MINWPSLICLSRTLAGFVFVALVAILCASPAYAILISYDFSGEIGVGELDLGGGPVSLDGQTFTASGAIISEDDLSTSPLTGLFSATTTYDFDSAGSFTTEPGEDFFFQFENRGATQFGLVNFGVRDGLFPTNIPSLSLFTDPNVPEAVGLVSLNFPDFTFARTQTNSSGDALTIESASVPTVLTTAKAPESIPEPITLALLGLGLAGLGFARKRLH